MAMTATEQGAQEARPQYTVTMASELYNLVCSVVLMAMCEAKVKRDHATLDLVRELAAKDHAKAEKALAMLDSLNYEVAA